MRKILYLLLITRALFTWESLSAMMIPRTNSVLVTMSSELSYKIFNQLSSEDKNSLMQACQHWYRLGKITPKTLHLFIFDPQLHCNKKSYLKLAELEIKKNISYDDESLKHVGEAYEDSRQEYIQTLFLEKKETINEQLNNKLAFGLLLKNYQHLSLYLKEIKDDVGDNFTSFINMKDALKQKMKSATFQKIETLCESLEESISMTTIKHRATIRFCTVGGNIFSIVLVASLPCIYYLLR